MNKGGNQSNNNNPSNRKNEAQAGSCRHNFFGLEAGDPAEGEGEGEGDGQQNVLMFFGFVSGGSSGKWLIGSEGGGGGFLPRVPP